MIDTGVGGQAMNGGNVAWRGTIRWARHAGVAVTLTGLLFMVVIPAVTAADPLPDLEEQAVAFEKAGLLKDAAAVYEKIAAAQPAARKVVAGRLVQVYVRLGEAKQALAWARQVMVTHPDPQSYLAGIYSKVGQHRAALDILEKELSATNAPSRRIDLCWQVADVYETTHQPQAARQWLEEAVTVARGQPEEQAARARLARVDAKREAKQ